MEKNSSDFFNSRCSFEVNASFETDISDTGQNMPNEIKTKCINLKRKGIRKRVGAHYFMLMENKSNGEETRLDMKLICTLTVMLQYFISLLCANVLHCYQISLSVLRTKGILQKPIQIQGKSLLCQKSGPRSKLCNKSPSVILSLIIFSFVPVMVEGFCPKDCKCDGTTLSFNCDNASLQDVPILLNPRVQTLLLTRNKIKQLSGSLVFYTELQKLDLSFNEIDSLGKNNFQALSRLEELRLSNNRLRTLENVALHGLTGVKVLVFSNNLISSIEDNAFMGLDSLVELDFSKNKLKTLSESSFLPLSSLSTLNLSGNKFGDVPSLGLHNLTSLLELHLSDNHISQVPGGVFKGMTKLFHLILDKNNISQIDPGAFSGLSELRQLSLSDNRIFQVPSIALSGVPDLHHLDMSGNLFETLSQDCFPGMSSLLSLTVSRCPRLSSVNSEAFLSTVELETLVFSHNPLLSSLSPAAFASLLNLRNVDLTACGLVYLTPTQIPVSQLESLRVSGNPLHCNCSMLWLAKLTSEANTSSSLTVDQPTCASPPTLYGVSLRELGEGGVGCSGAISLWTILICIGVTLSGLSVIVIFLICRWRRKKKKEMKKRNGQDKALGMWSDVWRPENHLSTTHLPPPPPPNGDISHYHLPSPPHLLRSPPRMPPDHPLHHFNHHHHQGCLQQCPYATLHPVYHPLLHPDHNSTHTSLETPPSTLYGNYAQTHISTNSPKLNSRGTPIPHSDTANWYETIRDSGDDEILENGRENRSVTPLDLYNNSPRKVPVTYV